MRVLFYWLRWVLFLPAVITAYLVTWGVLTVFSIPSLERAIINDAPGTYEVSSHFFWGWVLRPLASIAVGAITAVASLEAARFIAPSHQTRVRDVVSGMLIFLALADGAFIIPKMRYLSLSTTIHACLFNISLAGTAICIVFSKRSNRHASNDA